MKSVRFSKITPLGVETWRSQFVAATFNIISFDIAFYSSLQMLRQRQHLFQQSLSLFGSMTQPLRNMFIY